MACVTSFLGARRWAVLAGTLLCFAPAAAQEGAPDLNERMIIFEEAYSRIRATELQSRIDALTAGVDQIESVEAIKRLQNAYGHYVELGLWQDFADLFGDDAVAHYPDGDLNRAQILDLFLQRVGGGRLGIQEGRIYPHIVLAPVVTLDPDGVTAHARWRIVAMLGGLGGNATWAYGLYENRYVRKDGVWSIDDLSTTMQITGAYATGLNASSTAPLDQPTVPFHFDADEAGSPFPPVATPNIPGVQTFEALAMRLAAAELRLTQSAEMAAVTNLQHAYGFYMDRKLWDDVADLFADDGSLELAQRGVYQGRASIRHALEQFGPAGLAEGEVDDAVHYQTLVSVAPDGVTARARGSVMMMRGKVGEDAQESVQESAQWEEGIFENAFVKQDGIWKLSAVHYYPRIIFDYEEGWATSAIPAPGPSDAYPPDAPPTEVYETYPAQHVAPFHFRHPVTGAAPQYPEGVAELPGGEGALLSGSYAADVAALPPTPETTILELSVRLFARLEEAERALARAKAYHAAENVLNAYSYFVDERMWGEAADLFSANGAMEAPPAGFYVGPDRIGQVFETQYGPAGRLEGRFTLHQLVQPVIDVAADGQSAAVRQRLFLVDARTDLEDAYAAGVTESQVMLEDGVWKIRSMDIDYTWAATYSDGWARARAALPDLEEFSDPSATLPPDRPGRGPGRPPFPSIEPAPFHYDNPISGRPPAVRPE